MTDRNRRRDLTVRMRHKDGGLVVFARQANRRDRYAARAQLARETRDVSQPQALTGERIPMIIHKDSHTDHAITQAQWHHILDVFESRTGFFIETIELPQGLGFVLNELYGPSCGDAPVPEAEVHYARRGDRQWDSRLIKAPKRPTRFIRVIAGPHDGHDCVLFTAYGVSSKDMPAAPKEPGDIAAQLQALAAADPTPTYEIDAQALRDKLREAQEFWRVHALATEAH